MGTNGKHSILRLRSAVMDLLAAVSLPLCIKASLYSQVRLHRLIVSLFESNEGVHLRHHEVRLLRDQRVLLVDELDPLLDHVRRAAAAWKRKKTKQRLVMNNRCLGTKRGRQDRMEILYIVLWNKTRHDVLRVTRSTM